LITTDIFIRADGSREIGLGHLVRSLSLAHMLKDDFNIRFISKEIPESIRSEISNSGFQSEIIESEALFFEDKIHKDAVVVLDGYHFDEAYQNQIKKAGCKLACIDDIYERKFSADLIINHAPGVVKENYDARPETIFALGPDYALLRPAFLEVAENKLTKLQKDTLFICFGGADVQNKTKVALETALNFGKFKNIIIITGSAYSYLKELMPLVESHTNIEHHHSVVEKDMVRLMTEVETAIVPASGILFEALAAGNKVISGTYTNNQKQVYNGFKKLGAIIDAGHFEPEQIHLALLQVQDLKTKQLIDGKSPERIRNLFKKLIREKTFLR